MKRDERGEQGARMKGLTGKIGARAIGIAARAAMALAAAAGLAGAAKAQDVPQVISPLQVETDHNGVNIVTGRTSMDPPVLSVPAAPNLRFDRVQNAAPYVRGSVGGGSASYSMGSYSIHTGTGGSDSIRCVDYDCTPMSGNGSITGTGSTFIPNAHRFQQAGSGAIYNFNLKHIDTTSSGTRTLQYYASTVSYPNGETISYTYETATLAGDTMNRTWYRPTQVSSNLGYHITISYQGNTFGTNEWGTVGQATIYRSADPGTPLGRLTYSNGGSTITDITGRVFSCQGCTNTLGVNIEVSSGSRQLPNESSPQLQANQHATEQVVSAVVQDGVTWNYAYQNLRRDPTMSRHLYDRLTVTGPDGFQNVYDLQVWSPVDYTSQYNRITRITDSIGRATSFEFDIGSRPTRAIYPEGNEVRVAYDQYGNIISRTARAKPNSGLGDLVETAHVDTLGCNDSIMCWRPVWHRDAMGRQTDYFYNANGQLTEQRDPADASGVRRITYVQYETSTGISRRSVVRVCGQGTTCGTANEIRTEYEYWGSTSLPSVERRIDAARGITLTTTHSYDAAGRLLSTDGPLPGNGDATYNRYDIHGRKTWEIGALGANGLRPARRFSYRDSDDRPTAAEQGTIPDENSFTLAVQTRTDLTYDSRRNPVVEAVSAAGATQSVVQRSFLQSNRLECQAQRMNSAAFGSLPASACSLGAEGTQGPDRITRNVWDAAGQLLQEQRAYGTSLQQNYATFSYTPNGKRASVTDANGNRAEMRYDGHDRQNRWVFPHPTSTGALNEGDYEAYGYDAAGNRTSFRRRDGATLTFSYDGRNRMTVKNVPGSASGAAGYSVHYGYDTASGLQTYARFGSAGGAGITNAYDGFGRLISSTTNMDGTSRTINSHYDAGSRRTAITGEAGYHAGFSYDGAGNLTAYAEGGTSTVLQLGYDSSGRRSSLTTAGAATSYGYDPMSRLQTLGHDLAGTGADQTLGFGYNTASQIVTRTSSNDSYVSNTAYAVNRNYSVNGLNQYTTAGPAAFSYDPNGNLTSDGSTSYVYDAENRLVGASGGRTATLAYDPMGRLWQVTGNSGTTRFLYDGDNLLMEHDGSGNLLRSYVHGSGEDEPLVWYDYVGGFSRRFLRTDHQGSTIAVADGSGNAIAINAYDAWGIPNSSNLGRFGYTGQAWIPELGMYYYKARIYSPTLGRFLQTDPIGYDDQVNLYAYVANDPLNRTDPRGTDMAIIFSGPISSNPFGHVAVAFEGRGVYSFGTEHPLGSSLTDYMRSQSHRFNMILVIQTSAQQDAQAIASFRRNYGPSAQYRLFSNNCATAVLTAMAAAGIRQNWWDRSDPFDALTDSPSEVMSFATSRGAGITMVGAGDRPPEELERFNPRARLTRTSGGANGRSTVQGAAAPAQARCNGGRTGSCGTGVETWR